MALAYPQPPLTDGRVLLRRWAERDLDCVRAASTDPRIPRGTTVPEVFTPTEGLAFIRRQWSRAETGAGVSQAITEADTDRAVGLIIVSPRPQAGVAGVGYWVVPGARGRGLASAALRLVIPWAFASLRLQRLEAWTEPGNLTSQRVLLSAGLQHEGLLRNFLTIEDRPVDAHVFAAILDANLDR
ncbi:GNAT family N-acetyltransferase [Flexivirga caeni]|uniref:N-acetyltransferase n=1 Tax=Flexivirga caeni TaxID=2294115 RepID=A0A3M9MK79_9MICO|nr:GNAT family protein [Flexivirga caeni]RNI25283.1 N-acetyltransferase [Flexivirga caeni]